MQKITPFLWFNDQAEAAAKFYVSVFKNSKILATTRYEGAGADVSGQPEGSVMTVEFSLDGQKFTALNGGPLFQFTEAISFVVRCKTQAEVDRYWAKLTKGGSAGQCGWLKDKYGISWQIVPTVLPELFQQKDPEKGKRVMHAMLQMSKLVIKDLERAAAGPKLPRKSPNTRSRQ